MDAAYITLCDFDNTEHAVRHLGSPGRIRVVGRYATPAARHVQAIRVLRVAGSMIRVSS